MRSFTLSLAFALAGILATDPAHAWQRPKLVVLISIDQFRADYLTRFESRFLPATGKNNEVGGFRYLVGQGAYYPFAQYDILQSMTGPGHATLLTGAYPYQMGIALNYWFDRKTGEPMYCAEDASMPTVGASPKSPRVGTSPRNLTASTVGDELKNAGFHSRIVSLALKDRAAILMGGHRADFAAWFDQDAFRWVSSKFYLPDGKLPKWMEDLNRDIEKDKAEPRKWQPKQPASGLALSTPGATFSHETVVGKKAILASPYGLTLTEKAAERAVTEFKLGQGKSTDILAVSFSSHDYVGHQYGPNSREIEDMTLAEDREISRFLNFLKKKLPGGLRDTVIILTADHGAPPVPEWLKADGMDAGRVNEKEVVKKLEARLAEKFGKPEGGKPGWIVASSDLNIYLNHALASEKEVEVAALENEVKAELLKVPGIWHAFTATEYRARRLPPGLFERQILKTYFPGRSGDVIGILKPFYMAGGEDGVDHMTGYSYDRTVPVVLVGAPFKKGSYATRAEVVDIAPTLSFVLGTIPPSQAEGRVLSEAIAESPRAK